MGGLETYPLDDPDAASRWEALARRAEVRSPFSEPSVATTIARASGVEGRIHFASESGDDRAAVVTFSRGRGAFRRQVHPALSYYTPMLIASRPADAAVHERTDDLSILLDTLREHDVRIHLQLPPALTDVRPATTAALPTRTFYTYTLDPATADPATWSTSTRRLYRRYRNRFSLVVDPALTEDVGVLAVQAYLRSGRRAPFDPKQLARHARPLHDAGLVNTYSVRDAEGDTHGGVVVLRGGNSACYWIAGSEPGPAMTTLVGLLLETLPDEGIRRFDFLGANTPSIAEFKRRFGAALQPFHHIIEEEPLLWRVLRKVRRG